VQTGGFEKLGGLHHAVRRAFSSGQRKLLVSDRHDLPTLALVRSMAHAVNKPARLVFLQCLCVDMKILVLTFIKVFKRQGVSD